MPQSVRQIMKLSNKSCHMGTLVVINKWIFNRIWSSINIKGHNLIVLIKVDFFWINRDQKSFEWFVKLLSQLEIEQAEHGGAMSRWRGEEIKQIQKKWSNSLLPILNCFVFILSCYHFRRFLDMHMYVTSALQRTDMKAVGLQLALDLLHEKVWRILCSTTPNLFSFDSKTL